MLEMPVRLNDPLRVKTGPEDSCSYESCVEETAADEVLIRWPTAAGTRIAVAVGQVMTILFCHNRKAFEFDATVVNTFDDPVGLIAVRPSGPLRSIQRRNDLRMPVIAPVELTAKVVGFERFKDTRAGSRRVRAETVNICAGGFTIRHPLPAAVGAVFSAVLGLPGEDCKPLTMNARVVRCAPLPEEAGQPTLYEWGLEITRISEASRARIVRFVFGAQREERRGD